MALHVCEFNPPPPPLGCFESGFNFDPPDQGPVCFVDPDPGQALQTIPDPDSTLPIFVYPDPYKAFQIIPDPYSAPPPQRGGSESPTSCLTDYPGFDPESVMKKKI